MASVWMKWAALAVVLAVCVILVTAAPPSMYDDEELLETAADGGGTPVEDLYDAEEAEALTRTRRDSIGYAHGGGHKGWGWYPPVGPVFSYVRTDPWANFQWGVVPVLVRDPRVYDNERRPALVRVPRGDEHGHSHGHGWAYLGPVYTYAKTDHYANFKWGVRHHVGGHGWGQG